MKRRDFLVKTAFAGALFAAPKIFPFNDREEPLLTGNPLRFPPELIPGQPLILSNSSVEVWPGTSTQVISLNNSYPSPTIRVQKGDNFSVEFRNEFSDEATIHWHGLLVPSDMDGHPKDAVHPGESYTYHFQTNQRAGTYFYHSHAHMKTAEHVYKGFAGFFIIEDENELQYGLPTGEYDIPLLIQDRHSAYQPQFVYQPTMMDMMLGYLGNVPLVNGTPDAYLDVQRTLYRFRMVNGSNARVYKVAFSDNSPFHILATDGGLKDQVHQVNDFYLSPGERVDILYDFSSHDIGQSVTLKSIAFTGPGSQGVVMDLLKFNITGNISSGGSVPQNLPAIQYYDIANSLRTRPFILSQVGMGMGMHRINNLTFEMERIDEIVNMNELEEWKLENTTNNFHPMHVHGVMFQVYSRNGNTNLTPNDKGWKDTVLLFPNETVQLLVKFMDHPGIFLMHCHNLEHEDDGMMINLLIDMPTDVKREYLSPESFELYQNYPNPFNPSTTIKFSIPLETFVSLKIFDTAGREIKTLISERKNAGTYAVNFNASDGNRNFGLPSGVYYYKLEAGNFIETKKMLLVK